MIDRILITDNHEPLVSREDFAKVQERINQRTANADNVGYQKTYFAGMVKCGKCGYACNHVTIKGKTTEAYIDCNKRKTKECDLVPIKEKELKKIMVDNVGSKEKVKRIVLCDDVIRFELQDRTVKEHTRTFASDGRYKTPFSRKIYCGCCGATIVKMKNAWYCNVKKNDRLGCNHQYMKDEELYAAAKEILGIEENLDMQIFLQIEKTVSYNDRIEFHMKEGGIKVWPRQ